MLGARAAAWSGEAPLSLDLPSEAGAPWTGFAVREVGPSAAVRGTTLGGLDTTGEATTWCVVEAGGARFHVASIRWRCGEREVRRTRRLEAPRALDSLLGRQRLPVEPWGDDHLQVDLEQARLEDDEHARRYPASETELDDGAGVAVRAVLLAEGALAVGTRQEIVGATDERRHVLCATFPVEAARVPVVAFVLTCAVPLLRRVRARRARRA
ncbi:MAG: hypothetical protein ACC662_01415 [Planctomycetota bacterium]